MSVGLPTRAEPPPAPDPAHASAPADPPVTVIEPRRGWVAIDFRELWRFRELLLFLVWRDVKIRYKQTAIGAGWAVLQPVAVMAAMTFAFGRIAGNADAATPYWLFVLSGMVLWTFVATGVSQTGVSVVNNQNLVTKVYFPRLLLPLSATGLAGVDFLSGLVVLVVAAAIAGIAPGWGLLAVPLVLATMGLVASGLGVLIAALTVKYRDFRVVVPLVIQLWMFLTPAIYDQKGLAGGPEGRILLMANPVNAAVVNFRAAVLGSSFDWIGLAVAAVLGIILLVIGAAYFRRVERAFADLI